MGVIWSAAYMAHRCALFNGAGGEFTGLSDSVVEAYARRPLPKG
jgi:hypothetical protein